MCIVKYLQHTQEFAVQFCGEQKSQVQTEVLLRTKQAETELGGKSCQLSWILAIKLKNLTFINLT